MKREKLLKKEWKDVFESAKKKGLAGAAAMLKKDDLSHYEKIYNKTLRELLLAHQSQFKSIASESAGDIIHNAEVEARKNYQVKIKERLSHYYIMTSIAAMELEAISCSKHDDNVDEGLWGSKILALVGTEMLSKREIAEIIDHLGGKEIDGADVISIPVMKVPLSEMGDMDNFMIQCEKMIIEDSSSQWDHRK